MLVDQQLEAIVRAGFFRDLQHAVREAVQTLFVVRPELRMEAAFELFRSKEVSLLRAAEIAGLDCESFRKLLLERAIPCEIEAESSEEMDKAIGAFLGGSRH